MKKFIILLIAFLLSISSFAAEKTIYAWKDKNGVLVFSDTPRKGAIEVKPSSQHFIVPSSNADNLTRENQLEKATFNIDISSPTNNQIIQENTGTIYITSFVTPSFKTGFTIQLFINDKASGPAINSSTFALKNIPSGDHVLQLKLFDDKNQLIAISEPRIFHMRRKTDNE